MVEAPFLRKLAIGFAVLVRPVVSHNSWWYAMLGEDLLCETHYSLAGTVSHGNLPHNGKL